MKQGTGVKSKDLGRSGAVKSVNVGAVARLGAHENLKSPPKPMCKTVGVKAPKEVRTGHLTGSQGKHK